MNALVKTEIGLLPETWPVQRLGDVFETQLGKMLSQKAHGGDAPKPYLRNKNVQWGSIDTSDMLEMDFSEREKAKFQLHPGDLLICEGGVPGRAAIWNGAIQECYYQKALHRLRPRNGSMVNQFMLHWLRFAFDLQNLYGVSGASSTIAHLPEAQLKALPIPVPPLDEQRKIAAVLGLVQRAMEHQERLIALTTGLKRTLLHKLFTHGLRAEAQKQTEIGLVPQSWEVVKLAQLFQIKHGFAFEGTFFKPTGRYIVLTPGHFCESGGFRNQGEKTKFYAADFPRSYLLSKGDLLVAMTEQKEGLIGSSVVVPEGERYLHNQRLGLIQDVDEARLTKNFLYYLFNTTAVRKRISMTASGSKVRHTSPSKIRDVWVALPSLAEQHESVRILEAVDRKLAVTSRKHACLTDLFRTLLQQLMTAKTRVHDFDLREERSFFEL